MKKLFKALMLAAITLFTVTATVGCDVSTAHDCVYGFPSIGLVDPLVNPNNVNEFNEVMDRVAATKGTEEEPVVLTYHLAQSYTWTGTVRLNEYVYVGVCCNDYALTINGTKVTNDVLGTTDAEGKALANRGLFVYDCAKHGCYAAMDEACVLQDSYLQFAATTYNMGVNVYDATTSTSSKVPMSNYKTLPRGACALGQDGIRFSTLPDAVREKVLNDMTSLCLGEYSIDEAELALLRKYGVKIYTKCQEPAKEEKRRHKCGYSPVDALGADQAIFDQLISALQSEEVAGMKPSTSATENYMYMYLTENVSWEGTLAIPEGFRLGICKNGYRLAGEYGDGVYVFDCLPHACALNKGEEMFPLWQDALEITSLFMNEAYGAPLTFTSGKYALMEDIDVSVLNVEIEEDANVLLCLNGHKIEGISFENITIEARDCTLKKNLSGAHACKELTPHITAVELGEDGFAPYVNDENEIALFGGEFAFALTSDIMGTPMYTIPTGVKIHLCLNGYMFNHEPKSLESYAFVVEYGAEFTVCDCSDGETGKIVVYKYEDEDNTEGSTATEGDTNTEENTNTDEGTAPEAVATAEEGAATEEGSTDGEASSSASMGVPIYNLGKTTLNSGTLIGAIGIENAGAFIMNGGSIKGAVMGIDQSVAQSKEFPLRSSCPECKIQGGVISSGFVTVNIVSGDATIKNCEIQSLYIGIMATDMITLNPDDQTGISDVTVADVKISMTSEVTKTIEEIRLPLTKEQLQSVYSGTYVGIVANANINVEGDIVMTIDKELLVPYDRESSKDEDGDGMNDIEHIKPFMVDILAYENAYFNVSDNVELSDSFTVSTMYTDGYKGEQIGHTISNKYLPDTFVPVDESMLVCTNTEGELVVLPLDSAFFGFAKATNYSVSTNGLIMLNIYCEFTTEFLEGGTSEVRFVSENGDVCGYGVSESDAVDGRYVYSVGVAAKDYQTKFDVQFVYNGYLWTGKEDISVEYYLNDLIEYVTDLEEKANEAPSEDTASTENTENTENTVEITAKLLLSKDVAIAMLNYCQAAAAHFGVADSFEARTETLSFFEMFDMAGASVADAMEYGVTAEVLEPYKPTQEGTLPEGVALKAATLVLESGTHIRLYFTIDTQETVTILINDVETDLQVYKEGTKDYYVEIYNIAAMDLGYTYKVTVSCGDSSYTFTYSALSYAYTIIQAYSGNAEVKDLVDVSKAMCIYALAALYYAEA